MLPAKIEGNLCMHAQLDKNADITYMHANQKLKKAITIKSSIQIKFEFTIIFLMTRSSKQDHICLCLHEFFLNIYLKY